jgi:Tfp pilus assembly protein PilE
MKKTLVRLMAGVAFATALPAIAGPDWQIIELGRKVKAARLQQAQQQERLKHEQQARTQAMLDACREMMKAK